VRPRMRNRKQKRKAQLRLARPHAFSGRDPPTGPIGFRLLHRPRQHRFTRCNSGSNHRTPGGERIRILLISEGLSIRCRGSLTRFPPLKLSLAHVQNCAH
jgi:hypothetical protein